MKKVYRIGFGGYNCQRVLIYHLKEDKNHNLSFEEACSLNWEVLELKNYYVLSTIIEDKKKYIHIEKDFNVVLNEFPTCFFEPEIFTNNCYTKDVEIYIVNPFKNAFIDKCNECLLEVISNKEMKEILSYKL